jgi:hypothetical protein
MCIVALICLRQGYGKTGVLFGIGCRHGTCCAWGNPVPKIMAASMLSSVWTSKVYHAGGLAEGFGVCNVVT